MSRLVVDQIQDVDKTNLVEVDTLGQYINNPETIPVSSSGSGTEKTLGDWFEGQVFSYATLQDAIADGSLNEGDYIQTAGYYEALDGGDNRYLCVATGTGTDDEGLFVDHPNSPVQLKGMFPSGKMRVEQFGVVKGSRDDAGSNTERLNSMIQASKLNGLDLELGRGVIFFSDQLRIDTDVNIVGEGSGYWANQPAAGLPDVDLPRAPAPTQLVAVGDFPKRDTFAGVSSMRTSGADRINGSARADHNDDIYRLYSFMNEDGTIKDISIAILVDSEGVNLEGFRVVPDFGGDDGLLGYSDRDEDNWSDCNCDFGIWVAARHHTTAKQVDSVGHWRGAGLHVSQIRANWRDTYPGAGYRNMFDDCMFQGYRGAMIRGADLLAITGVTSNSISVPYSPDCPLVDGAMTNLAWNDGGLQSEALPTPISVSNDGVSTTIVFEDDLTDPPFVGATLVTVSIGGGNSHLHFESCVFTGMSNSSRLQCTDLALPEPMPHPSSGLEVSGFRGTEIVFNNPQFQTIEEVHFHYHDAAKVTMNDVQLESRPGSGVQGCRLIASPQESLDKYSSTTRGQTYRFYITSNNTWDDKNVDWRPSAPSGPRFADGIDDGFFEPVQLIMPSWSGSSGGAGPYLRPTGTDGKAGIKSNDNHPFTRDILVFEQSSGTMESYAPIRDHLAGYIESVTGGYSRLDILGGRMINVSIPNDDFIAINFATDPRVRSGSVTLAPDSSQNEYGTVVFSLISGVEYAAKIGGSAGLSINGTTVPDGTSGTDGDLSISVGQDVIYVENRTGTQGRYTISII